MQKRRTSVWPKVSAYLANVEVGETVHANKIAREVGGISPKQVAATISSQARRGFLQVRVVARGQAWIFSGFSDGTGSSGGNDLLAKSVPDIFELVRELKDGSLLLEDCEGELYKAIRISV